MTDYWANIEVSIQDPEIIQIGHMENKLGELPDNIRKIRELITRFEVCHFKYLIHLKKICDSISDLEPKVDPDSIGNTHIRHGEDAWKNDTTGKSRVGQQYVWALKEWLNEKPSPGLPGDIHEIDVDQIHTWLGEKSPDKAGLVRLLLARLTYDWESWEKLQQGGELRELEFQVSRMDICHYGFPCNMDRVLQAIGKMKPVGEKDFEGCGSYNETIRTAIEKKFLELNGQLASCISKGESNKNELIRIWLLACMAKTLKENVHLSIPVAVMGFQS